MEGRNAVEAALGSGAPLLRAFVTGAWSDAHRPLRDALALTAEVLEVDDRTLARLTNTASPQGVVAVARFIHHGVDRIPALAAGGGRSLALVLHDVAEPGNAGSLLRSALALGASFAAFGPEAVDPYNDKVVRSAAGALFGLPVVRYDAWGGFAQALRDAGYAVVGARAGAPPVSELPPLPRAALVIGNERHGLEALPSSAFDHFAGIAQRPEIDSLSAAAAGAILIYEMAKTAAS